VTNESEGHGLFICSARERHVEIDLVRCRDAYAPLNAALDGTYRAIRATAAFRAAIASTGSLVALGSPMRSIPLIAS
jgi:hypothetical protein